MTLVVIMASELIIKASPDDVAVVGRRKIESWLTGQPSRLLPSQVEKNMCRRSASSDVEELTIEKLKGKIPAANPGRQLVIPDPPDLS
jgi:hypothetical protein